MRVTLERYSIGYLIRPVDQDIEDKLTKATGESSILYQTDWDYPMLASDLGKPFASADCRHSFTDGTITCRECGKTPAQFIAEAIEWLDDHSGEVFDTPGMTERILAELGTLA